MHHDDTGGAQPPSTRPYLIRALYEWCTDHGFTPHLVVRVDGSVRVPREYVNNGEIVLNVSSEATGALQLGNEFIEFKARFGGKPHEILVPVRRVVAIYARENGQGMAFPLEEGPQLAPAGPLPAGAPAAAGARPVVQLQSVDAAGRSEDAPGPQDPGADGDGPDPRPPRPPQGGARPSLKRVK